MTISFSESHEADDLITAMNMRAAASQDGEVMRRAIDLIYQLRIRVTTQTEAIKLSSQLIQTFRRRAASREPGAAQDGADLGRRPTEIIEVEQA